MNKKAKEFLEKRNKRIQTGNPIILTKTQNKIPTQ